MGFPNHASALLTLIRLVNLHKLRGYSHGVYRIARRARRHNQIYLEVLMRCAGAFHCEQMKSSLHEWGTHPSEDMLAECNELEKLFYVINTPRIFMGIVEKNFVGFKLPEAVREDETQILNELSPLSVKNDSEHARIFKTQANKCAEVGCAFSDITLVIKFLNSYKRALADPTLSTPRATSARYVFDKLRRIFDDKAQQKRLDEIQLNYFLDMAARTSTELSEGATQTGNSPRQQRGGNPSKRSKNASSPQQSRGPFEQFSAAATAEPQPQRVKHGGKPNKQHGNGGGKGHGKGKGKGARPPYCKTCKQNHVPYGDECTAVRNQQPTKGSPPPNAHQATANLVSTELAAVIGKALTDHFGRGQGGPPRLE